MITETEKEFMDYIEANEEFLRSFHNIYHKQYRQKLNGYDLKEYMITSAIQMNKLKGYTNYTELCSLYLETLGEGSTEYGEELHNYYYETFLLNMDKEVQQLKEKYNKDDEEIYIAYEIKTLWSFYNGFMIEKLIKAAISEEANITLVEREEEEQQLIDNTMAIDVEVAAPKTLLGLQIKSYSYLNIDNKEKDKHIKKQQKYKSKYNSKVYYVLYRNNLPIYKVKYKDKPIPYRSYLFTQKDIKELKTKDTAIGTYEGLVKEIDDKLWLIEKIKEHKTNE